MRLATRIGALLCLPIAVLGWTGLIQPVDAQTVTAQSVILSAADLGPGWSRVTDRNSVVAGTPLYESEYGNGTQGADPRYVFITTGVASSADVAEAIITAVKPEDAVSVQQNGFGDGRAFKVQGTEVVGSGDQSVRLQYVGYVYRVRNIFALVEYYGLVAKEPEIQQQALAYARKQEARLWAVFAPPATATAVPQAPPPTATPVPAQPASGPVGDACGPGEVPHYVFGFAQLRSHLGDWMGDPVTCEYADPSLTGDVHQRTTKGLAFWRKSTNTPTFTNGEEHWALTTGGFVYWRGDSIDPPATGTTQAQNHPCVATQTCAPIAVAAAPAIPAPPQPTATSVPPTATRVPPAGTPGPAQPTNAPTRPTSPTPTGPANGYTYPVWPAPPNDTDFFCLNDNPSCDGDVWWAEWNALQRSSFVQFDFVGPGLVSEFRFIEAIALLWQWPEGKELLRHAAANNVTIVATDEIEDAFAAYAPDYDLLGVNRDYTEVSTFMLTDLLVHELTHASDDWAGLYMRPVYGDCIIREQRAFQAELRYIRYINGRFPGGLPSPTVIAGRLDGPDLELYQDLYSTYTSPDLNGRVARQYEAECSRLPNAWTPSAGLLATTVTDPAAAPPSQAYQTINLAAFAARMEAVTP